MCTDISHDRKVFKPVRENMARAYVVGGRRSPQSAMRCGSSARRGRCGFNYSEPGSDLVAVGVPHTFVKLREVTEIEHFGQYPNRYLTCVFIEMVLQKLILRTPSFHPIECRGDPCHVIPGFDKPGVKVIGIKMGEWPMFPKRMPDPATQGDLDTLQCAHHPALEMAIELVEASYLVESCSR